MRGNDEGPTSSQGNEPSVLVVAGDPGDVERLTRALDSAGYRVDSASGAAEGVARLRRTGFDLVVWDATLPENKDLARGRRLVLDDRPPVLFLITCDYLHTLPPRTRRRESGLRHQALPDDRDPGAGPGPAARPTP